MKTIAAFFSIVLLAFAQLSGPFLGVYCTPAAEPSISAPSAAVMDGNTGEILWSKDGNTEREMASTTKAMTLLLALEYCEPTLDSHIVTISSTADSQPGSEAVLTTGHTYAMRELLYALILPSGNDAAWAIAEHIGGSAHLGGSAGNEVTTFLTRMNSRASELGLTHTAYTNPHGGINSQPLHHTSAIDMVKLGRVVMNLDSSVPVSSLYATVVGTQRRKGTCASGCTVNNAWYNGMGLICRYPGVIGIKGGSTASSGRHYIIAARRNGRTLIASVLGAADSTVLSDSSFAVLDYGFARLGLYGAPSISHCTERDSGTGTLPGTINYTGTWNQSNVVSSNYDQDYAAYSNTTDNTAVFYFRGTGVEWWFSKSPSRGITEVSIDGVVDASVDGYNATAIQSAAVYTKTGLSFGTHTMTLRVTGTKNASATDYITSLDALRIIQ
jgi:D-alanyl-D-alanine carboxypeptidase